METTSGNSRIPSALFSTSLFYEMLRKLYYFKQRSRFYKTFPSMFAYDSKYSSVTFKTKERDNYKENFFKVLKVNRILGICVLSISM